MTGQMTPAQLAVLERIKKKKDLQEKKATKRGKSKASNVDNETAVTPEVEVPTPVIEATPSRKRKKDESDTTVVEEGNPRKTSRRTKNCNAVVETIEVESSSSSSSQAKEAPIVSPDPCEVGDNESAGNTTLTPAQLDVIDKLRLKQQSAGNEKSKRTPRSRKSEIILNDQHQSGDSVPTSVGRSGRRKSSKPSAAPIADTSVIVPPKESIVIDISDNEDSNNNQNIQIPTSIEVSDSDTSTKSGPARRQRATRKSVAKPIPSTIEEAPKEDEVSIIEGPVNPNMQAVIDRIKEKGTARKSVSKRKSTVPEDHEQTMIDAEPVSLEAAVRSQQLRRAEIRAVIQRVNKSNDPPKESMLSKLKKEGVIDAFNEGLTLTGEQNALVVRVRDKLNELMKQEDPSTSHAVDDAGSECEEIANLTSTNALRRRSTRFKRPEEIPEEEQEGDAENDGLSEAEELMETDPPVEKPRTYLIFDTNAYIKILPFCRALLESDALKDSPDYEDLSMYMLFVVINELDGLSKRSHKQTAMAAIKVIHSALKDRNGHIEGQDLSSSQEQLGDSKLNDDYILKSADILRKRGKSIVIVTDDQNLRVKISLMQIDNLNCLEFVHRYHWLTPLTVRNLKRDVVSCGEDMFTSLTECVVVSIFLKGIMAHLAPLPMDQRRDLFPSEKLETVFALSLKHRSVLIKRSGPFAVISYDRIKQTLQSLKLFGECDRTNRSERMKLFARFLQCAVTLCQFVAQYFPNMESRAELVTALADHFRKDLPPEEQVQLGMNPPRYEGSFRQEGFSRQEPDRSQRLQRQDGNPYFLEDQRPLQDRRPLKVERPVLQPSLPTPSFPKPVIVARPPLNLQKVETLPTVKSTPTKPTRSIFDSAPQKANRPSVSAKPTEEGDSMFFAFSQSTPASMREEFVPISPPAKKSSTDLASPFSVTRKPVAVRSDQPTQNPYEACQQMLNSETFEHVYDYFQKLGMSICNYTGSCCVKLGVRFPLGFQVSSANLRTSLHEVTEHFNLLLKAMKLLIANINSGDLCETYAAEFLQHSASLIALIQGADPTLVSVLPRLTSSWLCAFARDANGKKNLVTGYQQFCDFNNCLEKCWLEVQN